MQLLEEGWDSRAWLVEHERSDTVAKTRACCYRTCQRPPAPLSSPTAAPAHSCCDGERGGIDAPLFLLFGGPEGPDQANAVPRERHPRAGIPPERLASVAEHYHHFGGVSPINGINRALIDEKSGPNWTTGGERVARLLRQSELEPFVEDAVAVAMKADLVSDAPRCVW